MEGSAQNKLTVKLQYKDYEEGEFTDTLPRTAEETLQLIATYPWEAQRDHLVISLTNPSVTIEGPDNDYLKLSPFYNNKFALHYFDSDRHLYTQSFDRLSAAYPPIRSFFETQPFDLTGFKKETTWLQSNKGHFTTDNFHYVLDPAKFIYPSFLVLYLLFAGILGTFGFGLLWIGFGLIWLAVFLLLISRIAALAVNHYHAAKGNLLILSKGKDEFSFGPIESPALFSKKDIREIRTYGMRGKGGGYSSLTCVEIVFTDDRLIKISCLMIRQMDLKAKFPHCPQSEIKTLFPFITSSSATPS
jgi:hypothetical protein